MDHNIKTYIYSTAVNFMNRPISYSATLDGCRLAAKN